VILSHLLVGAEAHCLLPRPQRLQQQHLQQQRLLLIYHWLGAEVY
jgi:hypothetical protein